MSFLKELDALVEQAVANTFDSDERLRQKGQTKKIDKAHLRASGIEKKNAKDVEESEDDDDEASDKKKAVATGNEKESKLTGDPETVVKKAEEREKANTVPGTPTSKNLHDLTGKELEQPDFRTIAKNINLLRGGKSIKDDEVKRNLKDYIEKLSPVERREVLIYLNSLAQVMSGVKDGFEAHQPNHSAPSTSVAPKKPKTDKVAPPKPANKKGGVIVVGAS
jgi:hypothetical protein